MKNFLTVLLLCVFSNYLNAQDYVKNVNGAVVIEGVFNASVKVKSGTMYLYELKGNDEYVLDSTRGQSGKFSFQNRDFQTGVYRMAFNNSTNSLDLVINPKESNKISIKFNNSDILIFDKKNNP